MKSSSQKLTLQAIAKLLDERLSPIEEKLSQHDRKFDSIFDKLNEHDKKFDFVIGKLNEHDKKFDEHDRKFDEHDKKFDFVIGKLYEHDLRFDSIEKNMATKGDVNVLHSGIDLLCTIASNLEIEFKFFKENLKRLERRVAVLEKN